MLQGNFRFTVPSYLLTVMIIIAIYMYILVIQSLYFFLPKIGLISHPPSNLLKLIRKALLPGHRASAVALPVSLQARDPRIHHMDVGVVNVHS